jgi:streptomycin 3"-adenylyltransferase
LGIYLHGSLAMGGFNPVGSDVDVLVVTRDRLQDGQQAQLTERLLALSGGPCPIELSVVHLRQVSPWQFPPPFDYHFSEMWRQKLNAARTWAAVPQAPRRDPELAAHLTIIRAAGITLFGTPATELLPAVPTDDFLTAIWDYDGKTARAHIAEDPVYHVLTLCRILAYVTDGRLLTKSEAGQWALTILPPEPRLTVELALRAYGGKEREVRGFSPAALQRFGRDMEDRIQLKIGG